MNRQQFEDYLIRWNLRFPLDRIFRKSHNIVFGSEEHRKINQIDLFLQYVEDELYDEMIKELKEEKEMEKQYKNGKWLKDEKDVEGQEAEDLFSKLKIEDLSNKVENE